MVSAQFGAEHAATDDERARIHTFGPYADSFFVVHTIATTARGRGGDYTAEYLESLRVFLEREPRAAAGHAFQLKIN